MSLCQIFTSEYRISTRLILDIVYRISSSLIFERHPPGLQIPRYVDATSGCPAQAVRRAPFLAPTSASQSAPCLTLMPCQRLNLAMPFWHGSAQQRGHAKPGDAFLVCQRSTGGVAPSLAMNFGGPALHMGVVPSLAMLSGGQRSIGACTKPGDAPLTGQCSTAELS